MRVYVPDRKDSAIAAAIKDLYLLNQSLKYRPSNIESSLKIVDRIRTNLQESLNVQDD